MLTLSEPYGAADWGDNNDTTIVLKHDYSGQTFELNPGFRIDSVFFDPMKKVLKYSSDITLNQISKNDKMLILPNPANNFLNVQHQSGIIKYFQVFDLNGKPVSTTGINKTPTFFQINVKKLASGMYILNAGTSHWVESKKFVVFH